VRHSLQAVAFDFQEHAQAQAWATFLIASLERAPQQADQFYGQWRKLASRHGGARVNHDVPSVWYLRHVDSQDFADAPPNPVAYHRAAQGFFYAGAEAALSGSVWAEENDELRTRAPPAVAIHRFKFGAAKQANSTRKAPGPVVGGRGAGAIRQA